MCTPSRPAMLSMTLPKIFGSCVCVCVYVYMYTHVTAVNHLSVQLMDKVGHGLAVDVSCWTG